MYEQLGPGMCKFRNFIHEITRTLLYTGPLSTMLSDDRMASQVYS